MIIVLIQRRLVEREFGKGDGFIRAGIFLLRFFLPDECQANIVLDGVGTGVKMNNIRFVGRVIAFFFRRNLKA